MIDLLTYDKDYWNIYFNTLRGRPDIAVQKSIKRIGGMKAPSAEMINDLITMMQGKAIYDWKNDRITEITDPTLIKLQKLVIYEMNKLEPISVSVYGQLRNKGVSRSVSFVESALGVRPTKTEEDKRIQNITNRLFSLRGQKEKLYYYLGSVKNPREQVETYNNTVNGVLDNKSISDKMRKDWGDKLLIDTDEMLSNKIYQLTGPNVKDSNKIKKYLDNFKVSKEQAQKYLLLYWKNHPVKNKIGRAHV